MFRPVEVGPPVPFEPVFVPSVPCPPEPPEPTNERKNQRPNERPNEVKERAFKWIAKKYSEKKTVPGPTELAAALNMSKGYAHQVIDEWKKSERKINA